MTVLTKVRDCYRPYAYVTAKHASALDWEWDVECVYHPEPGVAVWAQSPSGARAGIIVTEDSIERALIEEMPWRYRLWGQVCDGRHDHGVGCFLHNEFPLKGRGWTYVEWRSEPYHPELCKYPTHGKVPDPAPFDPDKDVYRY